VNRRVVQTSAATLLVIMAGAAFLAMWQHRMGLGLPGVRVVNEPIYGIEAEPGGKTNTFLVSNSSIYLPRRVLDFESEPTPVTRKVVDWLPKDTTYGQRFYRAKDGFGIQATAVLMGKDRTSIHQPQYCLSSQGWSTRSQELTSILLRGPVEYELPVMKLTTQSSYKNTRGEAQRVAGVFVYWFVADKQLTARHVQRMWWMARDLLRTGVLQRWAYVTYFSTCAPGQEETTYARMCQFIAAGVPEFQLTPSPATKVAKSK
jgi:hypothetical protein